MSNIQFDIGKLYKKDKTKSVFNSLKVQPTTKQGVELARKINASNLLRRTSKAHATRKHLRILRQQAQGVWFSESQLQAP